jgi:2-keto-4-pentenoate hydratase
VALVELMRGAGGMKAGQYATTSSWTGLPYYKPGDHCRAIFEGLGEAELTFTR